MTNVTVDLTPVERAINSLENRLSRQVEQVNSNVGVVRSDLQLTQNELTQLRNEFAAFVATAARTAAVQQSETRVGNLRAELDRKYGHYGVVRRTSVGLLQAFDVGNVTSETVRTVSEELMIQTPRYWLAPVIVSLAAWTRDNKEVAEKSVAEAYARDPNKTSLFFALVMRRQGRVDAAARWLKHYLSSLDPSALTREFAVILEATSYNAFGPAAQRLLSDTMTDWCEQLRGDDQVVEEQVRSWAGEIGRQRERLVDGSYPALQHLSPDFGTLTYMLEQASALPVTIDKYQEVALHENQIPTSLENLLDDILDRLVTDYDDEELPLRRDVLYHESVIEEGGDTVKARERSDSLQRALDETLDVVSMQTTAAMSPHLLGVSTQTQRIAIGVGREDFRTAVGRYCAVHRGQAITEARLTLGPDHSNFASAYKFRGCSVTTATPQQSAEATIRSTWQTTLDEYIATISFKNSWYTKRVIIAAVIALVAMVINLIAGVVALLGGAAIVWYLGEQEKKKCAALVRAVEDVRQKAIDLSVSQYRDAVAEFVDASELYHDLDDQEGDLLRLIDTWPTASTPTESN